MNKKVRRKKPKQDDPRLKCVKCRRWMRFAYPTPSTPAKRRPSPHASGCMDCPQQHGAGCDCPRDAPGMPW
jgi:hypothetical protein